MQFSGWAVGYDVMSPSVFLLCLLTILVLPHSAFPSDSQGYLLNCGGSENVTVGSLNYISDQDFIRVGNITTIKSENLVPVLSTVRYFPDTKARKYCYSIPVNAQGKYLVRTIFYYGSFDGGKEPPVFDQIVGGTKWSIINTTEDYAKGLSSYFEVVVMAFGNRLSVCLARNDWTGSSSPFISALEVQALDASVYNPTNFTTYALVTVARHNFGEGEEIIGYPDDKFNRMWQPFLDQNPSVTSHSNVTSSDFWNLPPVTVFISGITTSRGKVLELQWPLASLPRTNYYIALYFQDNRSPSAYSWRIFDVVINNQTFFSKLNVTASGLTVYSPQWPLSGQTKITLAPREGSTVGPVINAGEILQVLPLGGHTIHRDVIAMEELAKCFDNPPPDWSGDPCLPKENSWTGVQCSQEFICQVISVNLTEVGLSGSLSPSIGHLTGLIYLWLPGNNLSGEIPDMSKLKELQTLNLENNQLNGPIPSSLGKLPKLREIYLQKNKLDGKVPPELQNRSGVEV
ncbi:probable LRR receptor-like serine/threonine-protein kinase At5g59680 [Prosopis cineraria]|uniref:probable LRR receptor-like serine/threonine-protein kinase At5g59680 n=1 Tax=Prosopis cineraria TaxID=364024 RepID=UPI0024106242|nr:probable LRR receptor-like serine/threonine-protein kinase At5g59680 [Prosopis cineraria]XP_054786099.1 probable LRR receptor-like serine/threonine-protein kinase At5g59680 [Prosopis cineraria]